MRAAACASCRNRVRNAGSLASDGLEQLDGDLAIEPGVEPGMHVGHAAATEECADLIAAGEQADARRRPLRHSHLVPLVVEKSVVSVAAAIWGPAPQRARTPDR